MDVNTLYKMYCRKGRAKLDDGKKIYRAVSPVAPYYRKTTFIVFSNGHVKELEDYAYTYAKRLMDLGLSVPRVDYDDIVTVIALLPDETIKNIIAIVQKYEQKRWLDEDEDYYLDKAPTYVITPIDSIERIIKTEKKKLNKHFFDEFKEKLQGTRLALPAPARRANIFRRLLLRLARV
ncbi:conserved hypothetical protein [Caldicellulosiruptor hydrothermalis 108]|uniref:Uncharacterized protein n=1 Tax=Caldicellulosiruptor hydrothermalis (strain DSM 18901 / VKM B-2411 / 108) TaxID=632292 RepID=E4QBI3_CALH1|nr:hypothetical protein [Caldicellulosiruptor hydrothermalis]ADQ06085.1 conserved hypothetical protein [Caldicellulosiruptor hydrothermalis 108]